MYDSRRRKSRRSRRGGSALSPALVGGRRSRRNRRGGAVNFPLSPANVGSLSPNADKNISPNGIAGTGLTLPNSQGGVMTQSLTAGGYRRRQSRRDRR